MKPLTSNLAQFHALMKNNNEMARLCYQAVYFKRNLINRIEKAKGEGMSPAEIKLLIEAWKYRLTILQNSGIPDKYIRRAEDGYRLACKSFGVSDD